LLKQASLRHWIRLSDSSSEQLNTAQENPLFDVEGDEVVHHGAFYQASLSLELDGPTLALALTAPITHSRIRMINDPDTNGGNAFLAADSDGSSGLMMVEYVAAGAIAEIRNTAQPASVGTLVLSRGAEEDATFASQGALQLERSVAAYRVLLCCELVGAVRLLRQSCVSTTSDDSYRIQIRSSEGAGNRFRRGDE
jgi:histidine ammonia-lyase